MKSPDCIKCGRKMIKRKNGITLSVDGHYCPHCGHVSY